MSNSTLENIAVEIGKSLQPLRNAISSFDAFKGFILELGWNVDDIPQPISALISHAQSVEAEIQKLIQGETIDVEKLIGDIKAMYEAVEDLKNGSYSTNLTLDDFANKIPLQLVQLLITRYLLDFQPKIGFLLRAFGILKTEYIPATATRPPYMHHYLKFDDLPELLNNPVKIFENAFGWGTDAFDSRTVLRFAQQLMISQGIPAYFEETPEELNDVVDPGATDSNSAKWMLNIPIFSQGAAGAKVEFGLLIYEIKKSGTLKPGLAITPYLEGTITGEFQINDFLKFTFSGSLDIKNIIAVALRPTEGLRVISGLSNPATAAVVKGAFKFGIANTRKDGTPIIVFGEAGGSRMEYKSLSISAGANLELNQTPEIFVELSLEDAKLVISLGSGDGFLKQLAGSGFTADFDLTLGWSNIAGIYFKGSAGLEIQLPSHIALGPIELDNIIVKVGPANGKLETALSTTIKADLSVLKIVVENVGVMVAISFPDGGGNLGPADFGIGFKPPNGLGISINAGAVIGGGYLYFDFDKQEYAGALELTIAGFISAKAIGLITTKMPDGSQGFSMLIIITAEFNPAFQLGYGFTLIGVGGLLGLNRTVLLDPLRDGVRTGAVNNIMFPQNVVANATRIISDLKAIFPVHEGKFLIGPMAKIGWGTPTLVSLSFGLIIEIPGNLAILGVLSVILPAKEAPLVKIQVAFVGTIDFDKQMLTFDASLYESSILTMTLEGDMAVRLKWGDNPDFLFTVGGFHPSFTPPPLALPTLKRLAINILNTSVARIRVECYQAITSNTVQFGAKADIFFGLDACSISGYISFDALFQFSPFYFIISVSAGFKLKVASIDLLSVRVKMSLEGPTPWRAKGTGSISILFFEVSADFDETWGESRNTTLPDKAILTELVEVLDKKEQWSTTLSTTKNLYVSLRPLEASAENTIVLHSAGTLVVQQKLLPFTINIDKIGNQKCSDVKNINITSAKSGSFTLQVKSVNDDFARAQYQKLSDAEKLSKPSFEKMPGGVEISMSGNPIKNGKLVRKKVEYELTIVDKTPQNPLSGLLAEMPLLFGHFLKGNSTAKSPLSKTTAQQLKPFDEKIEVFQSGYCIAFQDTNALFNVQTRFDSEAAAQTHLQNLVQDQPNLKKQIHIIPNFELQDV